MSKDVKRWWNFVEKKREKKEALKRELRLWKQPGGAGGPSAAIFNPGEEDKCEGCCWSTEPEPGVTGASKLPGLTHGFCTQYCKVYVDFYELRSMSHI